MCSKHVTFATIEICEFPLTLGDKRFGADRFPLTIEWEPQRITRLDLDVFERHRPNRRSRRDLAIAPSTREDMLIRAGIRFDNKIYSKYGKLSNDRIPKVPEKPSSAESSMNVRSREQKLSEIRHKQRQLTERLHRLNQTLFHVRDEPSVSCPSSRLTAPLILY